MKVITKKLSELKQPEVNVRLHTQKQLKEFERSINMFGQIRPIVIDETNTILAGNGLFETLQMMGKDTAECYQYTDLTENQKKKLMIADNKIFSLGVENNDALNQILNELSGDLDIPGYDQEVLEEIVTDAAEITEKVSNYGNISEQQIDDIQNRQVRTQEPQESRSDNETENFKGDAPQATTEPLRGAESQPVQTPQDDTEPRRFVICPKCGEKIWL